MNSGLVQQATKCVEKIVLSMSPSEVGYIVQALAAHILLRLDFRVKAINRSGHPDIVATNGSNELRFEIEAEVLGPRSRLLTKEDIGSLTSDGGAVGYYGLAIASPSPRWILVRVDRLVGRDRSSIVLLDALKDDCLSDMWTNEYLSLLNDQCKRIQRSSFRTLRARALAGRGL